MTLPRHRRDHLQPRHHDAILVLLNRLLYFTACLLLFVSVYVKFSSRGALGGDDLYGYGRVLAVSELSMIAYMALNLQWLRKAPPLVALIGLWLVWVAGTCAGLVSYGATTVVLSLLEVAYCPLLFLFSYAVHHQSPNLFRITHIVYLLLFAVCASMFLMVFKYQNASTYSKAGIPAVVIGPGSINQAHTKDEWLEIAELNKSVSVYKQIMKSDFA